MSINDAEVIRVSVQTRDDVFADAAEMVRRDVDNVPAAALAIVESTGTPRRDAIDYVIEHAPVMEADEERVIRRRAKKLIEKKHDPRVVAYVGRSVDELARLAEIDAEVEKLRIRDEARTRHAAEKAAEGAGDGETYVDVAGLGDEIVQPTPTTGSVRDDGVFLLYRGLNVFGGEPGAFKTGTAALCAVETLQRGRRVLWHDYDHNGAHATVARLLSAGAPLDVLRDRDRFRLLVGESSGQILASVDDAREWLDDDDLAVVDSAGELVAMFGGNSNDADDWTRIHREAVAPLATTGAAVLLLDHFPKTANGTGYATGTSAKKRTIDGAFYSLAPFKDEPPRPESVGKVALTLLKDRFGGTGYGVGECVAVLEVDSRDSANGPWSWRFMPGRPKEERDAAQADADVDFVLSLDPFPSSRAKLHAALVAHQGKGWRADRENAALEEARRRHDGSKTPDDIAIITTKEKK